MQKEVSEVLGVIGAERLLEILRAVVIVLVGLALARVVSASVVKLLKNRVTNHEGLLIRRGIFYAVSALFLITGLHQMGFNLGVLLGAAGILSVAVGFASQTSASNLISGLFLLVERPFSIGDLIRVEDVTGEVLSVDLLSVKIRTFDNLYVRIPNETLVKAVVTTLTKFPIRRIDLQVGVAYKEDLERVRDVLLKVADRNPLCLVEPPPLFIFQGFGDSSLNIQFSVWAKRENFLALKTSIQFEIKQAFDAANIEIPFPHITFYTGSMTDPLPIRLVDGNRVSGEET